MHPHSHHLGYNEASNNQHNILIQVIIISEVMYNHLYGDILR